MPELPEVETISRQLAKLVVGKKIAEVDVRLAKMVKTPLAQFKRALAGATIKKVGRRAKLLVLELDNGWSFLVHLKMTGQMVFNGQAGKHAHLIFYFSDKTHLLFNDLRQFGYIKLVKADKLDDFFLKEGIGPEPLEKDFTLADFEALLAGKPKAKIKQFLMDPKNIAGIGNIYSDEILFFAGVHPLRRNQSLQKDEIKKIFRGIKKILPEAVRLKGTSANNYLDAFGQKGSFLKKLKVYGREGQKCVKCKSRVARVKIGGRSAHFCPACQRL